LQISRKQTLIKTLTRLQTLSDIHSCYGGTTYWCVASLWSNFLCLRASKLFCVHNSPTSQQHQARLFVLFIIHVRKLFYFRASNGRKIRDWRTWNAIWKNRLWLNLTYQLQTFLNPFAAHQSVCITTRDSMIAAEQDTKQISRVTEICIWP